MNNIFNKGTVVKTVSFYFKFLYEQLFAKIINL